MALDHGKLLFRDDEWFGGAQLGALRRRARHARLRRVVQLVFSTVFAVTALGFGYGIVRLLLRLP